MNGLRIGTPELVRWGMKAKHADILAELIRNALDGEQIIAEVSEWRREFSDLHFVH